MKDQLRQYLKRHPRLKYFQKCISGYRNADFMRFICGEGSNVMRIESFGEEHTDEVIYRIEINTATDGFFALFRATLNYLYFADLMKLKPAVIWGKDVPYAEKERINGTDNPFAYYFVPISGLHAEDIAKSRYVIQSMWSHQSFAEGLKQRAMGYDHSEAYLLEMGRIVGKYIVFNEEVQGFLEDDCNAFSAGKRTIGIHVRGTDYKITYKNHPVAVSVEDYFNRLDSLFKTEAFDQIFLATDDTGILNSFKARYQTKVRYFSDTERADGMTSVAFSYSERKNHRYLLGYEVLRDAYALSLCDGFIGNLSQVSLCTRILKYSRNERFDYIEIIDHGIHQQGKKFVPPEKI
ncbi:MAG: O-fucosyltransferase family protein [Lachnospiraceae bacterium]